MKNNIVKKDIKKILIISITGIGENILQIPFLRHLKNVFPQAKISMALRFRESINLLKPLNIVDDFIVCDYIEQNTLIKKVKLIRNFRKEKYDICFLTFPSNRIDKLIFSKVCGAKIQIAHRPSGLNRLLAWFNNINVEVNLCLHDVHQNLNLLSCFNGSFSQVDKQIQLSPTKQALNKAEEFLRNHEVKDDEILIAVHAGSSESFNMNYKRWPLERYSELTSSLIDKYGVRILNFRTTKDPDISIQKEKQHNIINVEESLSVVLALLSKCKLFIGNDAAIMHLAAASGIKVIGIFGPTSPKRTGPYSNNSCIIESTVDCSPCYTLERLGRGIYCPYKTRKCLESITVSEVLDKAASMFFS